MDLNKNHVVCPQGRAKTNRRENLNKIYNSKEWERACDEVLNRRHYKVGGIIRGEGLQVGEAGMLVHETCLALMDKVPCEWHVRKAHMEVRVGTLVHHAYLESYKDGSYVDLRRAGCMVLCGNCHYAIHNELDLCRCGKYMRRGATMCRSCFDKEFPEVKKEKENRIAAAKALKKKLRDDEKERVKAYKKANPIPKVSATRQKQLRLQS